MKEFTVVDIASFWMHVKKVSSHPNQERIGQCWEWQGPFFDTGYGHFTCHQKDYRAHRVAFFLYSGTLPAEKIICHICDNKKCVNPKHLFEGTPKENTQDMIKKGRLVRDRPKKYKEVGISYRKESGKWRARYMYDYKNYLVGEFSTESEAMEARRKFIESFTR